MKTSDLSGKTLDWAVEMCEKNASHISIDVYNGTLAIFKNNTFYCDEKWFCPSTNWAQGGPIIEREEISTERRKPNFKDEQWGAQGWKAMQNYHVGPTPLIAAMRCYVASKLGDEIDVPEELCH